MLNWEDERYIRVYTRDTADWLSLSFEAQGLLTLLLRKADRAGRVELGKRGKRGVATVIGHGSRWETIAPALDELIQDGVIRIHGANLIFRNYLLAQEAPQSDAARQRARRERIRDQTLAEEALAAVNPLSTLPLFAPQPTLNETTSAITKRDELSRQPVASEHDVTKRDELSREPALASRDVTPCRAVPAVPPVPPVPPLPSSEQSKNSDCATDGGGEGSDYDRCWEDIQTFRVDEKKLPREEKPSSFADVLAPIVAEIGWQRFWLVVFRFYEDGTFHDAGWPIGIMLRPKVWRNRSHERRAEERDYMTGVVTYRRGEALR